MTPESIRIDEVVAELERLEGRPSKNGVRGFTTREFAIARGCSVTTAGARLRHWWDRGLIRKVGTRQVAKMSGGYGVAPVWQVVKPGKKARR